MEGCERGVRGEADGAADGRVANDVGAEGYFEDVVVRGGWWGSRDERGGGGLG